MGYRKLGIFLAFYIGRVNIVLEDMMKKFAIVTIFAALCLGWSSVAHAKPTPYTFDMSLVDIVEDTANAGLLGKPTWHQWIYKVEIVEDPNGENHNGLSHFTLGLEDCFQGSLLDTLAETAGANSGNLLALTGNIVRDYEDVEVGTDGSTGLYGIKWNLKDGEDNFETIGDYDYFWFSAPTDEGHLGTSLVKRGRTSVVNTAILTPDCPECKPTVTPEPSTMLLFGTGAVGFLARRRRKK